MKKQKKRLRNLARLKTEKTEKEVYWEEKFYAVWESHKNAIVEISEEEIVFLNSKAELLFDIQNDSQHIALNNIIPEQYGVHSNLPGPLIIPTKKNQKLSVSVVLKITDNNYFLELASLDQIDQSKQVEIELLESKLLFQSILDTIPTRVFWKDKDLQYLGCNRRFLEDAGLSSLEEIIGKNDYDLNWSEQAPLYQEDDKNVIDSNKAKLNIEEPQTTPQGSTIWLRTNKIPLKNHMGEVIGVLGCYDEITQLKNTVLELQSHKDNLEILVNQRAEEVINKNKELEQSESKFRSFIEQSSLGICLISSEGNIIEWNRAMSEIYKVPREKYLNRHVFEFDYDFLPSQRKTQKEGSRIRKIIDDYLSNPEDEVFTGEFERDIAGTIRFIQFRIFPIRTQKEKIFGRINIDVSERKAAEIELENYKEHLEQLVLEKTQNLQDSEARMRLAMQSVPLAYYSYEVKNASEIWYSEHIEALTGFSLTELKLNRNFWEERINKEDFNKVNGTFNNLKPNKLASCEYRWLDGDNQEIWIYDQAVLIEATGNRPEQIIGCFLDITERKESERALIESESNYHEIFNSSSDAIFIHNGDTGHIEDVNDTMLKMYGTSYDKIINSKPDDYIFGKPPFDTKTIRKHLQLAREKGMHSFEWLARRENKSLFWTEVNLKKTIINGETKIIAVVRDIDEKKKAESQIAYRHDFERLLFNFSSRFISIPVEKVDENIESAFKEICEFVQTEVAFVFRFVENQEFLQLTHFWKRKDIGIKRTDLLKIPYINTDDDWHTSQIKSNQVIKIEKPDDLPEEATLLRSIISEHHVNSILNVPLLFEGEIIGFLGLANEKVGRVWMDDEVSLMRVVGQIFINAIKRKEAVQILQESEQSHREIYNATNEAILIHDIESGKIIDVNNAMLSMFGFTYTEALSSSLKDISSGEKGYTYQKALKYFRQVLKNGSQVFEWQARRKDNSVFWAEVSLKITEIKGTQRMLTVIRDISERKQDQEILRESEEKYRLLIEGQTDLVVKVDTEGKFLFVSPSYCELFGKTEDELIGQTYMPLVHKEDQDLTSKAMENLFKPPYTCFVEQRAFTKHGWRWIAWNDKAVLDKNNLVTEIIGIGRDITYQKGVEEALRRSEDRFRSIVQQLSDIVLIIDSDTNVIYDTPSIKQVLGYDEGYLVGSKSINLVHPEDIYLVERELTKLVKDKNVIGHTEVRMKHASGYYIHCESIGINMLHHPSINGLIITLRDISERKLIEKKILDAVIKTEENERERFAKNLHDDLGPLLSSIKLYINSLNTAKEKEKQEYIISQLNEVVKEAITTTKDVSNDLSPHILINYGLVSAIESFLNKVPATIKTHFITDLTTERYSNTIENSFYRIIKELINNTLKHAQARNIYLELHEIGQNLSLKYTDDGKGFDPDRLTRGKHSGMGLSNIISRAKSLDANYDLSTTPDKGFKFHINIPINQRLE